MLLRVSFLLVFHFVWVKAALQCLNCPKKTLDLKSPETINTTQLGCEPVVAPYLSCSQFLHVQYSKKSASVLFEAGSSEVLLPQNAARLMINTTKIWLDRDQMERTFQIFCFNDQACNPHAISDIYTQVREFKYFALLANLITRLYEDVEDPAKLTCADNQDKSVACPNGFCQLISSDSSSFSRSCVLNTSVPDPYAVLLESKTISEKEIQSTLTYTCNKNMCNNLAMAKEVRSLLENRKILPYAITTTTTTTTKPTTVSIKASTGNTIKPLIIIQYGLVLLMATICLDFN